ncbi:MAG: hypothetical protein K9H64_20375 [Bacteroidales bacterium]|nr:hypothetical protein [Bacteroidales bacterium]MCF8458397.1 hypothetical protein [Bacteroidales bacterium]
MEDKNEVLATSDSMEMYEARKRIVLEMTGKFKPERFVYLITAILSFGLTIYIALDLYKQDKIEIDQLALFIGPTGFLAYAVSRILFMWSKSMKIIFTGKV